MAHRMAGSRDFVDYIIEISLGLLILASFFFTGVLTPLINAINKTLVEQGGLTVAQSQTFSQIIVYSVIFALILGLYKGFKHSFASIVKH